MKLIVDAFGGDNAPEEIVMGVLEGMEEFNEMSVILTGDEAVLKELLTEIGRGTRLNSSHRCTSRMPSSA